MSERSIELRLPGEVHPRLDFTVVSALFSGVPRKELGGEHIGSAFDVYSVEMARDTQGREVSTDLFVWGIGPPPDPRGTAIGGLPFWPVERPWPGSEHGAPYHYLAQLNFSDSGDLVEPQPGDLLVIFVPSDWEDGFHDGTLSPKLEWVQTGSVSQTLGSYPPQAEPYQPLQFYGVRHRTIDYPDAVDYCRALRVAQPYNLPVLNGTKIGGVPHFIQESVEVEGNPLCQLCSVQAHPNRAFPWTNREQPLSISFGEDGIYAHQWSLGDLGCAYVIARAGHPLKLVTECY